MPYTSIYKPDLFAGRIALVTGGGSGIGRCTAHELASLGAHVVLVGRNASKLDAVVAEIAADGGQASAQVADIRDEAQVKAMVAAVIAAHGRIDHLVNNAGGQFPAALDAISQNGFEAVVRTNLVGGFLVAREVYLQTMRLHGGGIVNMLADMWNGMPAMAHSGAARAGMENLTRTAAVEWAHAGVRVNAVAPGWIASSGLDRYDAALRPFIRSLPRQVPLQRLGVEAEVSAAIVFLLSPAAAFITGATLKIDGAANLGNRALPLPPADRLVPAYDGFHRAVAPTALQDDPA